MAPPDSTVAETEEARRLAAQRLEDRIKDAEARGEERERINSRLVKLEDHAKSVNGQITRLANTQDHMNDQLQEIVKKFDESQAVSRALVAAAKDLTERGVSTRTFVLGVGMLLIAVIALFVGSGYHP